MKKTGQIATKANKQIAKKANFNSPSKMALKSKQEIPAAGGKKKTNTKLLLANKVPNSDDDDDEESEDDSDSEQMEEDVEDGDDADSDDEEEDDDAEEVEEASEDETSESAKNGGENVETPEDSESESEEPEEAKIVRAPAAPIKQAAANASNPEKARTIFVNNVNPNATEVHLRKHFEQCGEIESIKVTRKGFKLNARIVFVNESDSKDAVELNNSIMNDFNILVVHAANPVVKYDLERTVVLKNTNNLTKLDSSKLVKIFAKCGQIEDSRIVCEKNVLAFITFKDVEGAKKALELNGKTVDGLEISTTPYTGNRARTKVFVKNIANGVTEQEIINKFQSCGPIQNVSLRQQKPPARGTAIVNFQNSDGYCKAFLLHEDKLRGESMYLEPFSEKRRVPPQQQRKNPNFQGKRPAQQFNRSGPPKKFQKRDN